MSPVFAINFRREAWEREQARARRRVFAIGLWVTYFGVMAMLLGLYGLNAVSFTRRVAMLERQARRAEQTQGHGVEWKLQPAQIFEIEKTVENPRRWSERLARLSQILPANARLTSVALNPQNITGAEAPPLVITGVLRMAGEQDRMRGVMNLVSALHADSVFARGYRNIQLGSTSVSEGSGPTADFVIECR